MAGQDPVVFELQYEARRLFQKAATALSFAAMADESAQLENPAAFLRQLADELVAEARKLELAAVQEEQHRQ